MNEKSCNTCKHFGKSMVQEPCLECTQNRAIDHYKPMTNADRIRQMTDEELEEIISCPYEDCIGRSCHGCKMN